MTGRWTMTWPINNNAVQCRVDFKFVASGSEFTGHMTSPMKPDACGPTPDKLVAGDFIGKVSSYGKGSVLTFIQYSPTQKPPYTVSFAGYFNKDGSINGSWFDQDGASGPFTMKKN